MIENTNQAEEQEIEISIEDDAVVEEPIQPRGRAREATLNRFLSELTS
jgi:hypothetical protein